MHRLLGVKSGVLISELLACTLSLAYPFSEGPADPQNQH